VTRIIGRHLRSGVEPRPIREGDRGPAVEDIQRRLLTLGIDLGGTGVDGVFLGATLTAVREFQRERSLSEDGEVGPVTWAALVDATFTLGDRLLYLRRPYFHGADVRTLQGALNALGFACGEHDGIFGAFTERALRDFQANIGLPADGIAGPDTVRAVGSLRHVWADKTPIAPSGLRAMPARSAEVLASSPVAVVPTDDDGERLAERVANLAVASWDGALVTVSQDVPAGVAAVVRIGHEAPRTVPATPVVRCCDGPDPTLATRMVTALSTTRRTPLEVAVVLGVTDLSGERELQHLAVGLLDGLCLGLVAVKRPVVS
jgi:peptidoglycan hydrolase-like protein with peptidoglycan-binding domain